MKGEEQMRDRKKKIKLEFTGDVNHDDILIGSHGDTDIRIRGNFQLSGTIYSPRYTITLEIKGDGRITFQGKCHRIVIKKMNGNCTLDLSHVTYKELHCHSLNDKSVVIAGKTRAITPAILYDDAILHVHERHLIFNVMTSGKSQILTSGSVVTEE